MIYQEPIPVTLLFDGQSLIAYDKQKIEAFAEMIADAENAVFLGGAGVSTESGIPDFRSKNGLYNRKKGRFSKYCPLF